MEVAFGANTLSQVVAMTALPAASMAFGSFTVNWGKPAERLQSQMQYFSAGLLIGAVIAEIFPILKQHLVDCEHRADMKSCLAAGVGFLLALFVMYGMQSLLGENENEDEDQDDTVACAATSDKSNLSEPLLYSSVPVVPKVSPECDIENAVLASCPPESTPLPSRLPRRLFLGVVVDSCVDGMLIGLSASVVPESGWLMAIATAIEMGFLGCSFACAVSGKTSQIATFITLSVPPMAMLVASCAAWIGAYWVEHSFVFAGLIAFALVALLFLVLQELLLEAREKKDGQLWQVSMWLYVGLLLSIFLDIFV
jgi:zinc transporter ZupT